MKRISCCFALLMGCVVSTGDLGPKGEAMMDIDATSDSPADGFGPFQGDTAICDDATHGELDERLPYHFWAFETDGCDDAFIDVASRDGDDMYMLLYQLVAGRWRLVHRNDDCHGSLNSCYEGALEAGRYLVGVSTYEYMRFREPTAASYELDIHCNDAGACSTLGQGCGSRGLGACDEGQFCNFPVSSACGVADLPGVCEETPSTCAFRRLWFPVCGCDGRDYDDACFAFQHGISVAFEGVCEPEGQAEGELCGGIAGLLCGEDLYCQTDYPAGCGGADFAGVCREERVSICPSIFQPVCSCGGLTYGNSCELSRARARFDHDGACE